ncbi:hypothetical protein [Chromobacterium amazonense]|uniref:Uncharacterized protein n=1 Tax=Chromobacterium amazonense TaxID=1382803 RepID=A0ABU8V186_9NEIS|nr:hypothetical protein [Chromobacterium amazonense]MDE1713199.1 hypothetical protein [Chromobacterium amazonense]MDQ4542241.1 hypothetical protein [Chromobacterium amazonense]
MLSDKIQNIAQIASLYLLHAVKGCRFFENFCLKKSKNAHDSSSGITYQKQDIVHQLIEIK